jgi:acyl carrier protein
MSKSETLEQFKDVLIELDPDIVRDLVTESTNLVDDLDLLWFDLIEMQLMLEEKFSIQLEDSDTDAIGEGNYRVGDWVERIMTIRNKQTQQPTKE